MSIRTYVFCAEHLDLECCTRPYELYSKKIGRDARLSIGDFVNHVQAEEARDIVCIFSDPKGQFSIVPIDPDGWCMFVSVARALGREWTALVKEMKTFANDYLKNEENTASMNDPQEVRRLWRQLDPEGEFCATLLDERGRRLLDPDAGCPPEYYDFMRRRD